MFNYFGEYGQFLAQDSEKRKIRKFLKLKSLFDSKILKNEGIVNESKHIFSEQVTYYSRWSYILNSHNFDNNTKIFKYWSKKCIELLDNFDAISAEIEMIVILTNMFAELCEIKLPCDDEYLISVLSLPFDVLCGFEKYLRSLFTKDFSAVYEPQDNNLYRFWFTGNIFYNNCLISMEKWNVYYDLGVCRDFIFNVSSTALLRDWFFLQENSHWYSAKISKEKLLATVQYDEALTKYVTKILKLLSENEENDAKWREIFQENNGFALSCVYLIMCNENPPKRSPVMFDWNQLHTLEKYKATAIYALSNDSVIKKVSLFIKNKLQKAKDLQNTALELCEKTINTDYAGPVAVEFLDKILCSVLNANEKVIYGCIVAHAAYEYDLPVTKAFILTLIGLSSGKFKQYLEYMIECQMITKSVLFWMNLHDLLQCFVISLYNSCNKDNVWSIKWFESLRVEFTKYQWSLDSDFTHILRGVYKLCEYFYNDIDNSKDSTQVSESKTENDLDSTSKTVSNFMTCLRVIFNTEHDINTFFKRISGDTQLNPYFKVKQKYINPTWKNRHMAITVSDNVDEADNVNNDSDMEYLFLSAGTRLSENENKDSSDSDASNAVDSSNDDNASTIASTVNPKSTQQQPPNDINEQETSRINNVLLQIQLNKSQALAQDTMYAPSVGGYSQSDAMSVSSRVTNRTIATVLFDNNNVNLDDFKAKDLQVLPRKHGKIFIKYPEIDNRIHSSLYDIPMHNIEPEPEWLSSDKYFLNKLYTQMNSIYSLSDQFNLMPVDKHKYNRDLSHMELWNTSAITLNKVLQFGGVLGNYALRAEYLSRWSNERNILLVAEDGILKRQGSNFGNIVQETLKQHVDILEAFCPPLKMFSLVETYRTIKDIAFLKPVPDQSLYDYCQKNNVTWNDIKSYAKQQNVHARKLSAHYFFFRMIKVCCFSVLYHQIYRHMAILLDGLKYD